MDRKLLTQIALGMLERDCLIVCPHINLDVGNQRNMEVRVSISQKTRGELLCDVPGSVEHGLTKELSDSEPDRKKDMV